MAIIITILKEVAKAILLALLSEQFIKEVLVYFLEWLVKKTDNEVDDDLVAKVKEALRRPVHSEEEK
jgi:hypothetical protein